MFTNTALTNVTIYRTSQHPDEAAPRALIMVRRNANASPQPYLAQCQKARTSSR
jgi:hypothetical protein